MGVNVESYEISLFYGCIHASYLCEDIIKYNITIIFMFLPLQAAQNLLI